MTRPLILVSNDDGVRAAGIASLARLAERFGEVWVSAPDKEQSGASHAFTLRAHLRVETVEERIFGVSGTPADSVYIGALHLCPRLPDLVLAGTNDGYNLGNDVYYSGTVGAAREGVLRGIPAIAASIDRGGDPDMLYPVLSQLIARVLAEPNFGGNKTFLNVNAPKLTKPRESFAITALGDRRYADRVESRRDLQGNDYYWIGGPPREGAREPGTDTRCVVDGNISVTPLQLAHAPDVLDPWRQFLGAEDS